MILFILGVIGLTHILVDSEIMEPIDEWAERTLPGEVHHALFECYQCSGFWCGVVMGLLLVSINPFVLLACGCAGSFVADFSETCFKYLERNDAT